MSEQEGMMPQVIEPSALEAIHRADYDVQISTAKKYPMHSDAAGMKRFIDEAKAMVTVDEATAESCLFALERGDKVIQGRSVRLAEIIVAAYGNVKAGSRIIDIGKEFVTAQGVCHDLERNVSQAAEVRRRITYKTGGRYNDDMIAMTCNAASAIAYRNAVYKVIPAAFSEQVYLAAREKAVGDASTFEARRDRALKKFALMGVKATRILQKLKRNKLEDVTLEDMPTLIGLYNAIRAGEVSVDDALLKSYTPPTGKQKVGKPATEQSGQQEQQTMTGDDWRPDPDELAKQENTQ